MRSILPFCVHLGLPADQKPRHILLEHTTTNMIASDFSSSTIESCYIHCIRPADESSTFVASIEPLPIEESTQELMLRYLLSGLKTDEFFHFAHEQGLGAHPLHRLVREVFHDATSLGSHSRVIGAHLHHLMSGSPDTEVFIGLTLIRDVVLIDEVFDALCVFIADNPTDFLQLRSAAHKNDAAVQLRAMQGYALDGADKMCLIINTEEEDGFRVLSAEKSRRNSEVRWWRESAMGLKVLADGYHQTQSFMSTTKEFITKQLHEQQELPKAETIALLNKSIEYFQQHEKCNTRDFAERVFEEAETAEAFQHFQAKKAEDRGEKVIKNFEISPNAVKKQQKVFKSVLKLDKNFHIYIHGDHEMIERGTERDGRKFYKIYYNNES